MSKSSFKLSILYAEHNEEVLASQAQVIKNAGHDVKTAVGRKAVEEAVRQGSFDLIVLGPTLSRNDRHHLPYMVKKLKQGLRVLVMHTDGERHPYVDANIDTGSSMESLIAKISAAFAADAVASAR
jgi:DNA-binding NtrC family response regulator